MKTVKWFCMIFVMTQVSNLAFAYTDEELEEHYKTHAYCYNCKIGFTGENDFYPGYYYVQFQCENMSSGIRQYYDSLATAKKVKAKTCRPLPKSRR